MNLTVNYTNTHAHTHTHTHTPTHTPTNTHTHTHTHTFTHRLPLLGGSGGYTPPPTTKMLYPPLVGGVSTGKYFTHAKCVKIFTMFPLFGVWGGRPESTVGLLLV